MDGKNDVHALDDFAELDAMFGMEDETIRQAEHIVLSQNLDGFANCFPDWDIHPPVK